MCWCSQSKTWLVAFGMFTPAMSGAGLSKRLPPGLIYGDRRVLFGLFGAVTPKPHFKRSDEMPTFSIFHVTKDEPVEEIEAANVEGGDSWVTFRDEKGHAIAIIRAEDVRRVDRML